MISSTSGAENAFIQIQLTKTAKVLGKKGDVSSTRFCLKRLKIIF